MSFWFSLDFQVWRPIFGTKYFSLALSNVPLSLPQWSGHTLSRLPAWHTAPYALCISRQRLTSSRNYSCKLIARRWVPLQKVESRRRERSLTLRSTTTLYAAYNVLLSNVFRVLTPDCSALDLQSPYRSDLSLKRCRHSQSCLWQCRCSSFYLLLISLIF